MTIPSCSIRRLSVAICVFYVASVGNSFAVSEDGFLAALNSNNWPQECAKIREQFEKEKFTALEYSYGKNINAGSGVLVEIEGFKTSLPFESIRFSIVKSRPAGASYYYKEGRADFYHVVREPRRLIENYWDDPSLKGISEDVFGENFSFDELFVESFKYSPSDLICLQSRKNEDAKRIAMLKIKLSLRAVAPGIKEIFRIDAPPWHGFFYCLEGEGESRFEYFVVSENSSLTAGGKYTGECKSFFKPSEG